MRAIPGFGEKKSCDASLRKSPRRKFRVASSPRENFMRRPAAGMNERGIFFLLFVRGKVILPMESMD